MDPYPDDRYLIGLAIVQAFWCVHTAKTDDVAQFMKAPRPQKLFPIK